MAEISAVGDAPHSSPSRNEEDARNSTGETTKSVETSAATKAAPDSLRSTNQEEAQNSTSQTRKPPLISLAMLRRAIGDEIADLNVNEVSRRVHAGVLLKDDKKQGEAKSGEHQEKSVNRDYLQMMSGSINRSSRTGQDDKEGGEAENGKDQEQPYTHKYWVDKELNKSCWMVLPKALQIRCSDASRSLGWPEEDEPCCLGNTNLPIAELADVSWVDIRGKCKTIMLTPWTMYVVEIIAKTSCGSDECEIPLKLSLELPDGNKQGRVEGLKTLKKWTPIHISKFKTTPKTVGEIGFSLTHLHEQSRSGLHVKGVVFRPT